MNRAEAEIRARIAARGAIPFREFMELALFWPGDGYYTRPDATTGTEGDFATSSDVSPAFGRRLAVQAAEVHERLGGGPWQIVELGPGRGLLALDVLEGLAELAPGALAALTRYTLVEIGEGLAARQRERLAGAAPAGVALEWRTSLDGLPDASVDGVVLANEFLDALPVHLLARRGGRLVERHVALDAGGALALQDGPVTDPRLEERVARYGLCAGDGWEAEVCLALEDVLAGLARHVRRGAALFVDYGHPAARLADEDHRDGSLVGYYRHRVEFDLLARPGRQDLTAHVNWDHLDDAARAAGWEPSGRAPQDRFLLALGLVDDLVPPADPATETPARTARRLAARSLILPGAGAGQRFEAAGFLRGVAGPLRGFGDPFAGLG